jgi:hypothetical protein
MARSNVAPLPRVEAENHRLLALIRGKSSLPTGELIRDELAHDIAVGSLTRERACDGKVRYRTIDFAQQKAAEFTERFNRPQVAYFCPFCRQHHLATKKP